MKAENRWGEERSKSKTWGMGGEEAGENSAKLSPGHIVL